MTKISECEDCKVKLVGYSLSARTCDSCEAKRWRKAGAERTTEDIHESRNYAMRMVVGVCREDSPSDVDAAYGEGTYERLFPEVSE